MSKNRGCSQRKGQNVDEEEIDDLMILTDSDSEYQQEETEPLLGNGVPHFSIILGKSHIKPPYMLNLPSKFQQLLPSCTILVMLTYQGGKWTMDYLGKDPRNGRLSPAWKNFVHDNNLKIGDGCVFELVSHNSKIAKFKVQILRGGLPPGVLAKMDNLGSSSVNPIMLL